MLNNKAQASIEVLISILIILFLFTVVFLISIMKGDDISTSKDYLTSRESCIKLSSLLFLTSVFNYQNEINIDYSHEISRDNGLINAKKAFCYAYTKDIDKVLYQLDSGKFIISKTENGVKIDKQ